MQATTMNNLEVSMAQQEAWNEQMAAAVAQLTQMVAENSNHVAQMAAASSTEQDVLQATTMNNIAGSIEQQNSMNQQIVGTVSQLAQGLGEISGNMVATMADAMAQLQSRIETLEKAIANLQDNGKDSE
jgi:hypothetical protein